MTSSFWLLWALQLLPTACLGSCSVVIPININTVAIIIHKRRLYLQRIVQIFSTLMLILHKTLKDGSELIRMELRAKCI